MELHILKPLTSFIHIYFQDILTYYIIYKNCFMRSTSICRRLETFLCKNFKQFVLEFLNVCVCMSKSMIRNLRNEQAKKMVLISTPIKFRSDCIRFELNIPNVSDFKSDFIFSKCPKYVLVLYSTISFLVKNSKRQEL